MSTRGHDFIDNLINSVTKREQKNNNNVIRPAVVPDIVPEPFISSYGNLNLGKQSIVPRHSLEEDVDYENGAPDFRNYHEFSSNNQDHASDDSDSESNTIVTKTMATPGSDVGVGKIDEPPNTLSSSSPSSSPEEIKKHEESADGNNDFDAVNQINNSSSRVENNDEGDFEVKNTQEESQSKPSSYFSSSEDLEIKHSKKRNVKEILEKSDAINREMMDNDINNIRDNRNHLISESKNDVTKVSRIYSNHADLKNKKNNTSKENGVGDNAHLPSTVGRITDNLGSKIIRNPIANFDRTKEAYSQSDLDSTTRDYHRQQQNNKNAVNVKSTFTSAEKDPKNFEKLADDNYYHHHSLPHSVTSNIKASASSSSSSNREEPIITIHIGRIEVRAVSPLDSEEGNDYYNDSQTQRQSTAFQNHFQRLSLSDYLKQRAEGKI